MSYRSSLKSQKARSSFPRRLTLALKSGGLSQQDLVRKTGISATAISNYCRGVTLPAPVCFAKICNALKDVASLEWLSCQVDHNTLGENLPPITKVVLQPGVGIVPTPTAPSNFDEFIQSTKIAIDIMPEYTSFRVAQQVLRDDPLYRAYMTGYHINKFPSYKQRQELGERVKTRAIKLMGGIHIKLVDAICYHTGLSKVGVANILKGVSYPRTSSLMSLSASLGVSPYWLEYGGASLTAMGTPPEVVDTDDAEDETGASGVSINQALAHLIDIDAVHLPLTKDGFELWVDDVTHEVTALPNHTAGEEVEEEQPKFDIGELLRARKQGLNSRNET